MQTYETLNTGNNISCTINSAWTLAATVYLVYPRNMVCFGYNIVNSLHTDDFDNDDHDDNDDDGDDYDDAWRYLPIKNG
jgi:hypothetical protein